MPASWATKPLIQYHPYAPGTAPAAERPASVTVEPAATATAPAEKAAIASVARSPPWGRMARASATVPVVETTAPTARSSEGPSPSPSRSASTSAAAAIEAANR